MPPGRIEHSGPQPEVGDRHGQGLGPVEHRPVALGAGGVRGEVRGVDGDASAATWIIGWIEGTEVATVAHVGAAHDRRRRPSGCDDGGPSRAALAT